MVSNVNTSRTHPAGTAGEIMSSPVITVAPGDSVAVVAEALRAHAVSAVPVVDSAGAVLGLVSEYDLLAKTGAVARQVMTAAVISVSTGTAVADLTHLLVDRRIGRVPVLAEGRLVGIVSRGDLVALLATEWVCGVCGEPVRGDRAPARCPRCNSGRERFALQEQPPGS